MLYITFNNGDLLNGSMAQQIPNPTSSSSPPSPRVDALTLR